MPHSVPVGLHEVQKSGDFVVHRDVIMRMCPLLAIAPELYSVKALPSVEPRLQQVKASRSSKQTYCALPRMHSRAYWHSMPSMQGNRRHIMHKISSNRRLMHKISSLPYNAGCTLPCFV